jgi:gamma-glutamylcyclotransferase (GGCT)/AIG2-like uncharacterized protein YtfP
MNYAVFAYGTLIFQEILQAVIGRGYCGMEVHLHDYARYRIRGCVYPAIIRQTGASVPGLLYKGLDKADLHRLDDYESDFYERREVQVEAGPKENIHAWAYIIPEKNRHVLLNKSWNPDLFAARHFRQYLENIRI